MSKLRSLVEQVAALAGLTVTMGAVARATDIPAFVKLHRLAHALQRTAGALDLTVDQMTALNTFIITVHKAKQMSPATARAHVRAVWTLATKTAVEKSLLAPALFSTVGEFLTGGV